MKALSIVGMLFCAVVLVGCKKEETKKALTVECKVLEILNSASEKSLSCVSEKYKNTSPSTVIKDFRGGCRGFVVDSEKSVEALLDSENKKEEFFEKLKIPESETPLRLCPGADKIDITAEELQKFIKCEQEQHNIGMAKSKSIFNCD